MAGKDDSQAIFLKGFADLLKEHRGVLHTLPEICERFIDILGTKEPESQNFDKSREDEQRILGKRKKADLYRHYKSLQDEMARKVERIETLQETIKGKDAQISALQKASSLSKQERAKQLENELKMKTMEFEKLKKENEEEITRLKNYCETLERFKSSNDNYIKEVDDKERKLKELTERVSFLENELKSKDREMELIQTNKEDQIKEYTERFNHLKEQYEAAILKRDEELSRLNISINELAQEIRTKDDQIKEYKEGCKQFTEKCKVQLASKDEELKGMKSRLAYLSEKQVKKDQRKAEDTTSSNRPSEVENDFAAFMDEDRMDACEKMQDLYGSEEEIDIVISYPRMACMIFETAFEQMKETKEAVLDLFKVVTKNMIELAPKMGREYSWNVKRGGYLPYRLPFNATVCSPELEYPIDVLDALMLSLKETAHKCNLESLEQGVKDKIMEKWLSWLTREKSCEFSYSEYLLRKLDAYIKACIRLTWRMVTQLPPMQLEYQSSTLKDIHKSLGFHPLKFQETSSKGPSNEQTSEEENEIACYIWPALLDGGGRLIRAGEVFCKVKPENTVS